jgi:hypothetical protein
VKSERGEHVRRGLRVGPVVERQADMFRRGHGSNRLSRE